MTSTVQSELDNNHPIYKMDNIMLSATGYRRLLIDILRPLEVASQWSCNNTKYCGMVREHIDPLRYSKEVRNVAIVLANLEIAHGVLERLLPASGFTDKVVKQSNYSVRMECGYLYLMKFESDVHFGHGASDVADTETYEDRYDGYDLVLEGKKGKGKKGKGKKGK